MLTLFPCFDSFTFWMNNVWTVSQYANNVWSTSNLLCNEKQKEHQRSSDIWFAEVCCECRSHGAATLTEQPPEAWRPVSEGWRCGIKIRRTHKQNGLPLMQTEMSVGSQRPDEWTFIHSLIHYFCRSSAGPLLQCVPTDPACFGWVSAWESVLVYFLRRGQCDKRWEPTLRQTCHAYWVLVSLLL